MSTEWMNEWIIIIIIIIIIKIKIVHRIQHIQKN